MFINSDSKQCTESKPGRVHRVHTQRTLVAHTLRTHCAQAVRTTPCRGAQGAVSWPCPAVSQVVSCRVTVSRPTVSQPPPPPPFATQNFCHDTTLVARTPHRVAGHCCVVLQPCCAVSQPCCVISLVPVTIQNFVS